MGTRVVDASALAALLFNEPRADWVAAQLAVAALAAPALIEYELGNTCWKKCRRHPDAAAALHTAFAVLPSLAIRLHDVDLEGVLGLAERRGITFHDASYLWLAQRLAAPLVTLDERLAKLAGSLQRHEEA